MCECYTRIFFPFLKFCPIIGRYSLLLITVFFSFADWIVHVSAPYSKTFSIRTLKMVRFIFEILFLLHNIEFKIPIVFLVSDILFPISIADEPSCSSSSDPRYLKACTILILNRFMKKSLSLLSYILFS